MRAFIRRDHCAERGDYDEADTMVGMELLLHSEPATQVRLFQAYADPTGFLCWDVVALVSSDWVDVLEVQNWLIGHIGVGIELREVTGEVDWSRDAKLAG